MDYDENDFQSQNFQLVGEDSKFSTSLRSFGLPKFDLDEHLRFGSLVETEVLLGIQSQENNWIDFSSGSTAVEFSSSAAESCSISRHNNVWSEATSSESVDLLLKSVGENEIINEKAVIMESSANRQEEIINDNQVDLFVKKDDAFNSSMMGALPTDKVIILKDDCLKKLSSPSEGRRNLLTHLQGSSQASELEESRTVFNFDPSNGSSADGKISGVQYITDENPTSSTEAIEKLRGAENVLSETVLKGHVFDVLKRTNSSNIDDCNSSVVSSHCPLSITCRSNQDERLLMETTRFSDEQNLISVRSRSDLLYDDGHKENSMIIHSIETNNQLVPKSDALEVLRKCIDSVISEDADGFVSISCRTEPLLHDVEIIDRLIEKEDGASQLAKYEGKNIEDKSGYLSSKAIQKTSWLAEGHRSVSGGPPDDSMEDDDVYSTQNEKKTMSNDVRGQKLVTCLDDLRNKQYSEGQMTDANITDACASRLLIEANAAIQVNYEIQVSETGDQDRMNVLLPSINREKNVYVVEANTAKDVGADRQDMKLDADKDIEPDEASLLSVVLEAKTVSSPFTCKEGKSAVDSTEVHMAQVDAFEDMKSSVTCTDFGRVSLGMDSNVIEKVQDTSIADQQTAEESPLDALSRNKLAQKEFDSAPLPLDFENSMHLHLPPSEDTTDINVVVEKKKLLMEVPSTSEIIHSANKDDKLFRGPASSFPVIDLVSKKASDPESASHSLNMEDTSPGKFSPDNSVATKLDFPVKSSSTPLPTSIASFNLALEQKEESSSCSTVPDLLVSKENEVKVSRSSKLTNSSNGVDMETENGADKVSDCVQDALVNISTKNEASAVVQSLSPVKSIDFQLVQNEVPSSAVDAVRNGESAHLEGADSRGSGEGIDNAVGSLDVFSKGRNETSVFQAHTSFSGGKQAGHFGSSIQDSCSCKYPSNEQNDQCNFSAADFSEGKNMSAQTEVADNVSIIRTNDSSPICIASTVESNPSEKQSGNLSLSDCFRECPQDNLEHPEVEVSQLENSLVASGNLNMISSSKDETAQKLECSGNDLEAHTTPVEVRNFTFEVSTSGHLPERGVGSEQKSLPSLQSNDIPQMLKENPQGFLDKVKAPVISAKKSNKGKTKNAYTLYKEKKTGSRERTKKEAAALKQSSEMDAKYSPSQQKYVGPSGKELPLVDLRENPSIECCAIKTSSSLVGQTSSIPDLNSSSTLFQQSFTDLQQVQLRAQIFVYGALISGIPPDEAYMVSAFGDADGGRRLWEGIWQALITKFQNQKSPISGYETPSHSRSVSAGTNVQSKVPGSSTAKGSSKIMSSAVLNSTVPLPSPLWSLSYGNGQHGSMPRGACLNFNQTASPLSPWRPAQLRQHLDASPSWFPQASHPGPWFVSSHSSALDGIKHFSAAPFTETMHATCASDLCGPHIPTQVASPTVLMSVTDLKSTTTDAVIQLETTKKRGNSGSNKHTSKSFLKAGKLKRFGGRGAKFTCFTNFNRVHSYSRIESLPLPSANTLLSSNSPVKVASGAPVSISMSHLISPTHHQIFGENNNQRKANLLEETCSKVELAKLRAEDAAAAAASSIKHCQAIWSQLAAQKNSGLVSQIEEKLASAAVAAAGAASVAKAAAAAAKVASDVAWQAKIMSDEAISAAKTSKVVQSPESGSLDVGKKLAALTPISILKGMDKIHESVEVMSAAREAAKRRIESASVATKQAENLDAIVKAAELAAEAVAQAGIIIAMGDPLPFTLGELVDAGTEEFWKVHHGASMKDSKLSDIHAHEHVGLENVKELAKQSDGQFANDVQSQKAVSEGGSFSLIKRHEQAGTTQGNFLDAERERDHSGIQKGSQVEVMSDEDGLRGAWFSARVLDMKDNKAYVCYNDFSTKEGHPKEWIVLENEREKAPRIRPAVLATAMRYEGTRKRRREHHGSYIWAIGDHVDAWMHDRWWEGAIVEKSSGDDTKLTVQLLAKSDKLVVDAWNVRPALIWKDGQWMEWFHTRKRSPKPHEGDTPTEKRQKLGGLEAIAHSEVDAAGIGIISKNILVDVPKKPEDSRSLILTAKERAFTVGKNSRDEITSNVLKTKRSGLQKEGSRVVFGVPKPGKKRKFMEVSKHYVEDKFEKVRESSDPMKFAKYLMPQASQKFKSTSKVDNKGKKPGDSKSRVGVKAENSQGIESRSQTQKADASLAASNGEARHENLESAMSSFSSNNESLEKTNTVKFGSSRPTEILAVESANSGQPAPTALLSKRKNVPGSESEVAVKAKSIVHRTTKSDDKGLGVHGKTMHEIVEPRRSNRRIQPTSRLLEGIQSSLIISKMPSISHEKKSSRGNGHS
ncbi:LOW QUALITY PROTEIN: uncharacterized protein LOC110029371 [Phalaenopsis equestris]|uniref:LOW QUALITY PROTEIN: uncharacterized protein LOC110029371 n=1 Tax=Phalaenopsis equestris TaxID=78828 RepID=UPI0009E1C2CF|nr:LOW QUALITY PROTEIN: uncharacterized protein LOC110029371 [Phalaenopsis equestris]